MKKTLYIMSSPPAPDGLLPLPSVSKSRDRASVVLIQNAVTQQEALAPRMFVLEDDAKSRNVVSPFPVVSYQDLLGMIFDADNVAVV